MSERANGLPVRWEIPSVPAVKEPVERLLPGGRVTIGPTVLCLVSIALGLLAAAASDVQARRVPNAAVLVVATAGLLLRGLSSGPMGAASGLATGFAAGALLWGPWRQGIVGGGDLKLAAAASFGLAPSHLPTFLVATAIAGGVMAMAIYATVLRLSRDEWRVRLLSVMAGAHSVRATKDRRESLPYAVAIAVGAIFAHARDRWS